MKVAFLGLGLMGSRMAMNLQKAGIDLYVYNRNPAKAAPFIEYDNVKLAQSPADAVADAEVVITMLSAPDAVREVALGLKGFLPVCKPGTIWVDCSTVNPSFSVMMAEEAESYQVKFLDAPVAGSIGPAAAGELIFFVGGDADHVATVQPLFDSMGKATLHVGPAGKGASLKLVFNVLLGQATAAFADALILGESMGFERDMLLDKIVGSAVVPPFLQGKKEKIATKSYEPEFPLKLMLKDLVLAQHTAKENGVDLPMVEAAKNKFSKATEAGLAHLDFSAVIEGK